MASGFWSAAIAAFEAVAIGIGLVFVLGVGIAGVLTLIAVVRLRWLVRLWAKDWH